MSTPPYATRCNGWRPRPLPPDTAATGDIRRAAMEMETTSTPTDTRYGRWTCEATACGYRPPNSAPRKRPPLSLSTAMLHLPSNSLNSIRVAVFSLDTIERVVGNTRQIIMHGAGQGGRSPSTTSRRWPTHGPCRPDYYGLGPATGRVHLVMCTRGEEPNRQYLFKFYPEQSTGIVLAEADLDCSEKPADAVWIPVAATIGGEGNWGEGYTDPEHKVADRFPHLAKESSATWPGPGRAVSREVDEG